MTLSTYSDLKAAVADWLERADLTARIPDFIRLAEVQIGRTLRERRTMRRATAVITDPFSAAPGDLLEVRTITMADGGEDWMLAPTPPEDLSRRGSRRETGRPRFWSLVGEEFRYYPAPDRPYLATLTYEAQAPALSEAQPSNWLLVEHPDVYLFGALKEAAPFLRDAEAAALFETKYRTALEEIRQARRAPVGVLRVEAPLSSAIHDISNG